ncbi:MAG: hypothetical protein HY815_28165 [Candidatus Riflebacteria bacterium]|nr:hypothetical protein [Candidatus Riflebacteria bacterium]
MRRAIHLAMAALMVVTLWSSVLAADSGGGTGDQAAPAPSVAPAKSGVQEAIDAELATRAIPTEADYRAAQHLSWHMCWHLGHRPERYHHEDRPDHDEYHYLGKCRQFAGPEALARARKLAEQEIAAEGGTGAHLCFAEDPCCCKCPKGTGKRGKKHCHVYMNCGSGHAHHVGIVWANEWERSHKRYFWKIVGDISAIGQESVPPCEGHAVPPPKPVRWNDSNQTCPLPYDTWFKPPAERTVVVPFPLPREGDWRAHISALMNKIVDQTDWLRAVNQATVVEAPPAQAPECPQAPEGD